MPTGRSGARRTPTRSGQADGESVDVASDTPAPSSKAAKTQPETEVTAAGASAPAKAVKAKTAKAGTAKAAPATSASAKAAPAPAEPAPAEDVVDEPVPANRAERRAHSRGKSLAPKPGQGKVAGQKGPVQGPRMWANRRSG
jgi:hypothetical protein